MKIKLSDLKKEIKRRKIYILASLIPLVFIVGILSGVSITKQIDKCQGTFKFINSVFNCGHEFAIEKSSTALLELKLNNFIEEKKLAGEASEISIFFRDLEDGPVLGINDDDLFTSASLLKLPIALTSFKLEEERGGILERKIRILENAAKNELLEQYYRPKKAVAPGTVYTIEELINSSLVYSDNLANDVLKEALMKIEPKKDLVAQTYRDLGLIKPENLIDFDISTRNYASIFRILYNAAYLSPQNSEKVLSILSNSDYNTGIAKGIPKNLDLANKFGERFIGETKQLHDCGIIYYPDNPYVLCVMTRGYDYNELEKVISEISKIVYEEVDSRRIN